MAGWFTIHRDGDRTTIQIDKSEIRQDARGALDKGREFIDRREEERQARLTAEQNGVPYQYTSAPADAYGQPPAYETPAYGAPQWATPAPPAYGDWSETR